MGDVRVLVPKKWTAQERALALEHPGRRTDGSQTAASWVSDLSALRKTIILCAVCRVKFNPRKHGYRRLFTADPTGKSDGYAANGRCDGCKQRTESVGGGVAFVHETLYQSVCVDPVEARRKARLCWRRGVTI